MYRIFLAISRVCLIVFLIGGFALVVGQVVAIAIGSGPLMEYFGTSVADTACMVAGLAGICAFLLLYTREGRELDQQQEE
jgi:membrane protein implicated in regulation of membrane protease activity